MFPPRPNPVPYWWTSLREEKKSECREERLNVYDEREKCKRNATATDAYIKSGEERRSIQKDREHEEKKQLGLLQFVLSFLFFLSSLLKQK